MSSSRKWVKERWNYDDRKNDVVEDYGITIEYERDGDQSSYDWSSFALLSRKQGGKVEYAAYTDGGCSCNYMYEMSPDFYDLDWVPEASEAVRQIKVFMKEQDYHFSAAQYAEESVKLRQWVKANG